MTGGNTCMIVKQTMEQPKSMGLIKRVTSQCKGSEVTTFVKAYLFMCKSNKNHFYRRKRLSHCSHLTTQLYTINASVK